MSQLNSSISESALLTLRYRAKFYREVLGSPDTSAETVVGTLNSNSAFFRTPIAEFNSLYLGQRAWLIDEVLEVWLHSNPNGQIVNLGCGLETIFQRLSVGTWSAVNVDFEDIIKMRTELSLDLENTTTVSASILQTDWVNRVDPARPIFFVLSGVLNYLPPSSVDALLKNLNQNFDKADLVFDTTSWLGRQFANLSIRLHRLNQSLFLSSMPKHLTMKIRLEQRFDLSNFNGFSMSPITKMLSRFGQLIQFGQLLHVSWGKK